jgi:midasin (ATPase involved in ribosome maturation)
MNPPYTSAGKKQLPQSLRDKVTELYVSELTLETDLWPIIDLQAPTSMFSERQKRLILAFYMRARELVRNVKGNIGLRNLCRALKMMKQAVTLKYPVIKAIYDSLYTCFASHLDAQLQL